MPGFLLHFDFTYRFVARVSPFTDFNDQLPISATQVDLDIGAGYS